MVTIGGVKMGTIGTLKDKKKIKKGDPSDFVPTNALDQFKKSEQPPTPTPQPTPEKNIKTGVTFNQDNTVDYSVGGKTYKLSRAEYEGLQGQPGGTTSQTTKDIQYATTVERAAAGLNYDTRLAQDVQKRGATQDNLAQQVGDLPMPGDLENGGLLGNSAATVGLNIGAIAAGAGSGAAVGSLGGPAGSVIGGVIGAAGVLFGKLSLDKRQDVKVAKANYDNAKSSLGALRTLLVTNPELREDIVKQWNDNLVIIRASERTLKAQNRNLIGKKLASNLDELSDIEQFYRDYELLYEIPFKQTLAMT